MSSRRRVVYRQSAPPDKVPLIVPALTAPGGSLFPRSGMSRPTASPQEERHSFASAGGGRTLTTLPVRGGSLDGSAEGVAARMASGCRPTGGGCSGGASAGSSTNHPEHHVLIDAIVVAISLLQDGFVGFSSLTEFRRARHPRQFRVHYSP
jgi:hypothetical protein